MLVGRRQPKAVRMALSPAEQGLEGHVEAEQALIDQAATGDMVAFRALYDLHVGYVSRNVARLTGPGPEVEDLTQDVFVQVYKSLAQYRGDCAFKTWLYRVTRNVTIDHLRKRRVTTVELDAWRPLRGGPDAWSRLEARDLCRVLHAALQTVAIEYREAFLLHEVEGMKLREIADLTEESINTVAARIRRTREKLQAILEQKAKEGDHV
ncbi:RNA polymerase sigma factor [Microvenator marinus]|uniref:RNA polymerase sigma factor n=2 Tax=Microvenator marinus TaxID=2600177 RepID=A0A5B8XZR3_9DELT|nr:RNA polymerase sigma factor [Microvenator marinus]